ncbi:SHC-transforming protein 1-like protein, partial [Leptotrombidium deliense]
MTSDQSWILQYVGCLAINTSMKSLDFETRSLLAKECINRVCESAGLKTNDKKRRTDKRIAKMFSDSVNLVNAGASVSLTVSSSYLSLTVVETGEVIANHEMPNISFASGGDSETLDFVAYVAKDYKYGRACFVLECGGGLAQQVITAIGQAFEVRFKEYLKKVPKSVASKTLSTLNHANIGAIGGTERDYYNDLPGKMPPDVNAFENLEKIHERIDRSKSQFDRFDERIASDAKFSRFDDLDDSIASDTLTNIRDPFDMRMFIFYFYVIDSTEPFNCVLENVGEATTMPGRASTHSDITKRKKMLEDLEKEEWFHGPVSRKESEILVANDGDFLIRESIGTVGQYVLTGMQNGLRKHLLLVDPEGVVRTKDKTFDSVSHLINYHRDNGLPIISAES